MGSEAKENKHINTVLQSKRYDPQGAYLSHWLPALKRLSPDHIHQPFALSSEDQNSLNFILGRDYPKACVRMREAP